MTVTKSGVIIKAADGSTINTTSGTVVLSSPNANYSLKFENDGIKINRNGEWSTL
jgi:hypothetical protein